MKTLIQLRKITCNLKFKHFKPAILMAVFCITGQLPSYTQTIIPLERGSGFDYQYGDSMYKYEDMDKIFSQDDISYNFFLSANKKRRTAKTWKAVSITGLGLSTLLILTAFTSNDAGAAFGGIFYGVGLLTYVGIPSGIISIVKFGAAKRERRNSIILFNSAYKDKIKQKEEGADVSFSFNNGLGLQLRF